MSPLPTAMRYRQGAASSLDRASMRFVAPPSLSLRRQSTQGHSKFAREQKVASLDYFIQFPNRPEGHRSASQFAGGAASCLSVRRRSLGRIPTLFALSRPGFHANHVAWEAMRAWKGLVLFAFVG